MKMLMLMLMLLPIEVCTWVMMPKKWSALKTKLTLWKWLGVRIVSINAGVTVI